MLRRCSTEQAPWYVIPANRKWFRNLAVSQILREELEGMNLKYPKPAADLSNIQINCDSGPGKTEPEESILKERTGPGWRQQVCSERPQTAERSGFYRGPSPSDSLSPLRGEREQKFDRFVNFVTTKWN